MSEQPAFQVGQRVVKVVGYCVHGVVRSVFQTSRGEWRLVVEIPAEQGTSFCHIFNASQLAPDQAAPGGSGSSP